MAKKIGDVASRLWGEAPAESAPTGGEALLAITAGAAPPAAEEPPPEPAAPAPRKKTPPAPVEEEPERCITVSVRLTESQWKQLKQRAFDEAMRRGVGRPDASKLVRRAIDRLLAEEGAPGE